MAIGRREFLSLVGAAAVVPVLARAQDRLPSVGVLTGNVAGDPGAQMRVDAFRQGLALLMQRRMPAIFAVRFYALNGGLMSYGADLTQQFRDGAGYVDRILRGAEIRALPVQFATRFKLVINMKAVNALGLTVPNRLLMDAELIE